MYWVHWVHSRERGTCKIEYHFMFVSLCSCYGQISSHPNYHRHTVASAGNLNSKALLWCLNNEGDAQQGKSPHGDMKSCPVILSHWYLNNRHYRPERSLNMDIQLHVTQNIHLDFYNQHTHKHKLTLTGWSRAPAVCMSGQQTDRYGKIVKQSTQHLPALLN